MSAFVHRPASNEGMAPPVSWPQRVIRFMASGLVSFVAQVVALLALIALGVPATWANLAAIVCGAQVNFVLSARLTWADRAVPPQRAFARWARFTASLSLTNALNEGIFLLAQRGLPLLVAAALGSSCAAILNFMTGDRLVFGQARSEAA